MFCHPGTIPSYVFYLHLNEHDARVDITLIKNLSDDAHLLNTTSKYHYNT